jgi:ParB family chromosome partitioning protein
VSVAEPLRPEARAVSMNLIDEPDLPTRERMDPDGLQRLADSIAANGLINPIALEERLPRYVILAGHRRFIATKMLGAATIDARIYPAGIDRAIAIQASENAHQQKPNAGEEGEWFQELYVTKCGSDLEKLSALTGLSESYLSLRLIIAQGDPRVRDAVKAKEISATVAAHLNRITDDDLRFYYLESAKAQGAGERLVKLWVSQAQQIQATRATAQPSAESAPAAVASAPVNENRCACCAGTHDVSEMVWIQLHKYCNQAIVEPFMRKRRELES